MKKKGKIQKHIQKVVQKKLSNKIHPVVSAKKKIVSSQVKSLMPKIAPLGSRVLIKPFTKEELNTAKNSFGIILPDTNAKEKSEQGKVLAVGPGEWRDGTLIPVSVNVGDIVAFSKYGYDDVSVEGEEYYLVKEENILAVLK